ncbi:MAG: hypothetical protein ABW076_07720 [Candidatus Thiodiazotropha sp.]
MDIFEESNYLADELLSFIELPLLDNSERIMTSDIACSLSIEHWHSARALLNLGFLPSALVVHRAQFEALTRSIWLAYAASELQISKLTENLSLESEQAAKNMPQVAQMMEAIKKAAPTNAYDGLYRFKEHSWKALNSYAHAGIHPIRRHHDGYPIRLVQDVLRNTNGLAVISFMQAVVLSGQQQLQKNIIEIANNHTDCMPPPI